jgi:Amt family ammonium transporter
MLIGAGIIWIGWNGFNGGDPYAASQDAGVAVINTNIATALSVLVWIALDCIKDDEHKMSVIGAIQGMLSGLVAITPAAGVVNGWGAIIIGLLAGSIPCLSMRWRWERVDDVLQVFDTHAVAGVVGGICVGLFATTEGCAAFGLSTPGGAIEGNWRQVSIPREVKQLIS